MYTSAKKLGIKPIIGCEMYLDGQELRERSYPAHLTVLARNEAGYRALIAANNLAHRQFYYRPRLTFKQILENGFAENWLVLSGCMSSLFHVYDLPEATLMVQALAKASGRFFLETMVHQSKNAEFTAKQATYLERIEALQKATGLPVAITNDCHFAHEWQENTYQELLDSCTGPTGLEFDGLGFYFKSLSEMQQMAQQSGYPNALDNSLAAGRECHVVIPEADTISWYVPDITNGQPYQTLKRLAEPKLRGMALPYVRRYEREMQVLSTSPAILNSYLVTHDVVQWCRDHGIAAAARGSMAGSIVSWLLGITQEDPVKYNLKFERAVSPGRPTIPDFDLDVSSSRRGEVLNYLQTRYTHNIPICAYTHYGPRGSFRKISNMKGNFDQAHINAVTRQLPADWADGDFEYSPTSKVHIGKAPWTKNVSPELIPPMATYEGVFSTVSVHPSGIIISGPERDPENELPRQWIASSKMLSSAYDMYTLKKLGIFKLDVLGLSTLDQLDMMKRWSNAEPPDDDYDDANVLGAFSAHLLTEIFQMDGYACREVMASIGTVVSFEDLISVNTLARPGASQFVSFYRSGLKDLIREYPPLEPVLGYTNGLILYQEQVMEIAQVLADFNDIEQDDIKESIKYFKHEEFNQHIAPLFRERCAAKGVDATNILNRIVQFSKYTFNRAHAMTYSAIAYKMMWYKVYHPAAFYAAVFDKSDDRSKLVLESHLFNVEWQPADVNASQYHTEVVGNKILLGLSALKGIGFETYKAIASARPYTSGPDFETRVPRKCNSKARATIKDSFALASLGEPGNEAVFQEAYGFSQSYLNGDRLRSLEAWQQKQRGRVAGYLTRLYPRVVRSPGPNKGRDMAHGEVSNSRGSFSVVIFPDVWRKAQSVLFRGAPVALEGSYPTEGDFIVEHGYDVNGLS